MKKTAIKTMQLKRLAIRSEAIAMLTSSELGAVVGGASVSCSCPSAILRHCPTPD